MSQASEERTVTEPAGRIRRLTATVIDMILVPALTLLMIVVTGVVEDAEDFQNSFWMVNIVLLAIGSYIILNGETLRRRGQTLGKAAMGIRIVDARSLGPAPLWKLLVLRAPFFPTLFMLPMLPLTVIPVIDQAFIFSKGRRCLHDYVAGTLVVRQRKDENGDNND